MTTAEQQAKFYRDLIKYDIDGVKDPEVLHYLWLTVEAFREEERAKVKAACR